MSTLAAFLLLSIATTFFGMNPRLGPTPAHQQPPATIEVKDTDVYFNEMPGNAPMLRAYYKVHDSRVPSAHCQISFRSRSKAPFAPALPSSDQGTPDIEDGFKRVTIRKPGTIAADHITRIKATWLRSNGTMAYSIERTGRFDKLVAKDERLLPFMRLMIPMGTVNTADSQTGFVQNAQTVTVTIDCGSGPQQLPSSHVTLSGTSLSYHFTGLGHEGQTCIVCVAATNEEGTVMVCYEITFNPLVGQAPKPH